MGAWTLDTTLDTTRLREIVRASPTAVGLVALPGLRFVELSAAGAGLLGVGPGDAPVDLATLTCDPSGVRHAIALLAGGVLDACRVRTSRAVNERDCQVVVSLRLVTSDGEESYALALLEPADASNPAFMLDQLENRGIQAWMRAEGSPCRAPAPFSTDRARLEELEHRLRRIADELEAAGALGPERRDPDTRAFPGLEDLTDRQREILARLLRGDRVPTISRGMHLATSTVRNHLTTMYRKVGVHSQAELIERLHATNNI